MTRSIEIVEVGPRDGLQNESQPVPTDMKVALCERLLAAAYVGGSVALSIVGLVIGLWTMRTALA